MPSNSNAATAAVALAVLLAAVGYGAVATAAATATTTGAADLQAANATNATDAPTVTVSATGTVEAEPDLAVVRVSSTATADDPATATRRLAANVSTMRAALSNATLSPDRIRTTGFTVFQTQQGEPPNVTTAYVARQSFAVELDDLNRTGEIVDVAIENGATEVDGVSFTLSEGSQRELRNRALAEAMADARSQAETVADAENLGVVGVRRVTTVGPGPVQFETRQVAATPAPGTEIDPSPVTVTATVTATYEAAD